MMHFFCSLSKVGPFVLYVLFVELILLMEYQVYGNNIEIQAMSEMYNRPIHIYSYSTGTCQLRHSVLFVYSTELNNMTSSVGTEPINTFHGSYNTDTPPIRLSYHHGNHYNSLVDPRRLNVGAGLGFSCLRGVSAHREYLNFTCRVLRP